MRTKKILTLCFTAAILIINHSVQAQSAHNDKHSTHHKDENINMNKGKKWIVDEKMLSYIRKMEKDINGYDHYKDKDYKLLAGKLKENVNLLVGNCSMSGKAHDELHKWLVPYLVLVDNLNVSKSESESEHTYKELKVSFSEFNKYFE